MKSLLVLAVLALGLSAQAQIKLGNPTYGGTGCPAGSASVNLTEDGGTLSFLFDGFVAQAPTPQGASFDRKSCNLRIPVQVGPGYQVGLLVFDYRGFAAIPPGGSGQVETRYAYVGQKRPVIYRKRLGSNNVGNFDFKNELISTSVDWMPCSTGRDLMLTVDANTLVVTNPAMQAANVSIDSIDASATLIYKLQLRRCF